MKNSEQDNDYKFMQEKIKERPVNKRKLLKRTVITVSMAAIFGLVACLTFLLLEPVFSNWLYPPEKPEIVQFPEETQEMRPEDMLIDESSIESEATSEESEVSSEEEIRELDVEDYQAMHTKLYELAKESAKSIVTVTGVTSDLDWFDNPFENKGHASGLIIANNGKEYLILVNKKTVETVENIRVTFGDTTQADAVLKATDAVTGLAVISVEVSAIKEGTSERITTAVLGSSNSESVNGGAVIAIGSPLGNSGSIGYGNVTSTGNALDLVDSSYKLITSDIYGSQNASGVLVNLKGQVIGIINQEYNPTDTKNLLSVIGISELKDVIAKMSNGMERAYVGIRGIDVTTEAFEELKVPMGAYVTEIEMDSPAMQAGIRSGDVIVGIGEETIESYGKYIETLNKIQVEETIEIKIMRQSKEEYTEIIVPIITSGLE